MADIVRPILRYRGAKWRIASWVIKNLPPHQHYLEPFFGSGAVFFRKASSPIETINDLDGRVVNFFRVLRDQPEALIRAVSLTPWARREFKDCRDRSDDPVESARRFAVRCWQARAGRIEGEGWARSTSVGPVEAQLWADLPARLRAVIGRMAGAQIECKPALELIGEFNSPEVLIYADPPYLLGPGRHDYAHELTDEDHEHLLATLLRHTGPVVVSGYPSALYGDTLRGWVYKTHQTVAHEGAKRTEAIWISPLAAEMLEVAHGRSEADSEH